MWADFEIAIEYICIIYELGSCIYESVLKFIKISLVSNTHSLIISALFILLKINMAKKHTTFNLYLTRLQLVGYMTTLLAGNMNTDGQVCIRGCSFILQVKVT